MLKSHDVLKKISEDPTLMAEFKKAQSFEELCELCKKIEPNITEKEVEESLIELIDENTNRINSSLSDDELNMIAGGNMDFNKTKALALSALVLTGLGSATMLSDTAYASGESNATSVSQKAETGTQDQKDLDRELEQKAEYGDIEAVKKLLNKGARINSNLVGGVVSSWVDAYVSMPGTWQGKPKPDFKAVINLLLDNGANISVYAFHYCFFHDTNNVTKAFELLLERGADVNAKDEGGNSVLSTAIKYDYYEGGLKLLLKKGATIKNDEERFLLEVIFGNKPKIEELLNKGVSVNSKDSEGATALVHAIIRDHTDIAKFLIEKGADINESDGYLGSPLIVAAKCENIEITKILLDRGTTADKNRALYRVGNKNLANSFEIAKLLLDKGANPNTKYVLANFAEHGNLEAVKLMINKLNQREKNAALISVIGSKLETRLEMAKFLLDNGASPNSRDRIAGYALQYATRCGDKEMIKLLTDRGAGKRLIDKVGNWLK